MNIRERNRNTVRSGANVLNTGYLNTKRLGIERVVDGLESVCSRTIESPAPGGCHNGLVNHPLVSVRNIFVRRLESIHRGIGDSSGPIARLNLPIFFHFEAR